MEYIHFNFEIGTDFLKEIVKEYFPKTEISDGLVRKLAKQCSDNGYWELVEKDIKEVFSDYLSNLFVNQEDGISLNSITSEKDDPIIFNGKVDLSLSEYKEKLKKTDIEGIENLCDEEITELAHYTSNKMGWDGIKEDIDSAISHFAVDWSKNVIQ